MSKREIDTTVLLLSIVGYVLGLFATILAIISVACTFGWEAVSVTNTCTNGSVKEMAFAIIGAIGALWGASAIRGSGT